MLSSHWNPQLLEGSKHPLKPRVGSDDRASWILDTPVVTQAGQEDQEQHCPDMWFIGGCIFLYYLQYAWYTCIKILSRLDVAMFAS